MITIWAVWIDPINKTVNSWRTETVPPDWERLRDRWHLLHAGRFILSGIAFCSVIAALAG